MEEPKSWITVNGNHIPIFEGQNKYEAMKEFFAKQANTKKETKKETKQMALVYFAGKSELVDKEFAIKNGYKIEDEINIDESEIEQINDKTIGNLNDYSYKNPTDYAQLKSRMTAELKLAGIPSDVIRTKYMNNLMNQTIFKIKEHKANEFLKEMPKITDKATINSGANLNNFLYSRYNDNHEYTWNCQRCVAAWYLRHLGYDVEAMPYVGEENKGWFMSSFEAGSSNDKIKRQGWSLAMFCNPTVSFTGKDKQWASSQFKEISNIAQNDGPGACYIISLSWRGSDSSHVAIIHNDNGEIKFIDPQDDSDASKYFNPKMYGLITNQTKLYRIDKSKLNGEVISDIVRKPIEPKEKYDSNDYKEAMKNREEWSVKDYERKMKYIKANREYNKTGKWVWPEE